jgi:hypothetical protein
MPPVATVCFALRIRLSLLAGGVIDRKVIQLLEQHLGCLYSIPPSGGPLPAGAPPTTVAYLGFGKYVLYIVSVLAVPGLAKLAGDAPALFLKGGRRRRRAEYAEMLALEWKSLASLLSSSSGGVSSWFGWSSGACVPRSVG